jgi:death-on-curing protein
VIYLSLADILTLHHAIMVRTGSTPMPLRDEGLLESAIMRPQMAAHYAEADLVHQCAVLTIGISQAQAFVDGNKRTAYAACDVFLRLNGAIYTGEPLALAQQLEAIASRDVSFEEASQQFEEWLREYVKPSP